MEKGGLLFEIGRLVMINDMERRRRSLSCVDREEGEIEDIRELIGIEEASFKIGFSDR